MLLVVALPINATHSIIGSAAPMDIGGKNMAGFSNPWKTGRKKFQALEK